MSEDLKGKKFGRLLVIKQVENDMHNKTQFLCRCDCGKEKIVRSNDLKRFKVLSCGCLKKEELKERRTTHGKTQTRIYRIWCNIKSRCTNKNMTHYIRYGGRGITICQEWLVFENFYNWAVTNGYNDKLTIDRIDNNGNYEPSNCRWVDAKIQARNSTQCHYITYNNETYCINEWAENKKLTKATIHGRLKRGWSIEKTLNTPLKN